MGTVEIWGERMGILHLFDNFPPTDYYKKTIDVNPHDNLMMLARIDNIAYLDFKEVLPT